MWGSQDSDQQSYHYVPHVEFPDLRGFEEVPAYQVGVFVIASLFFCALTLPKERPAAFLIV